MSKLEDLTGKKFGRLTPVRYEIEKGRTYWICDCECGHQARVLPSDLKHSRVMSCGCYRRERSKKIDLVGQKFGDLTVVEDVGLDHRSNVVWLCRCDCGKEKKVLGTNLIRGVIRGCGTQCPLKKQRHDERIKERHKYKMIYMPQHPNANPSGKVFEHVIVMSSMIGRPLHKEETVHHKNGIPYDNRPENLELWASNHPKGQRIEDQKAWAKEFLKTYLSKEELMSWILSL